jgi:FkbM family methyltransferase
VNLTGVWKPWYVYRPQQIFRRAIGLARAPSSRYQQLRAAWGVEMLANPAEHLGRSLWTTGVYDLSVSEVMFRLVQRSDLVLDAGANIGYMTLLASVAAGPRGRVISWEPNPALFGILTRNVDASRAQGQMAPVELRQAALGAHRHRATLVLSDPARANDGLSYIPAGPPTPFSDAVDVQVETLDDVLGNQSVAVAKVDVEGYEHHLFKGAEKALTAHRIRHIVFEDHEGTGSTAAELLKTFGYSLFSIGWSMTGPLLAEIVPGESVAATYEAPSYLATVEPERAIRACTPSGWRALRLQTALDT